MRAIFESFIETALNSNKEKFTNNNGTSIIKLVAVIGSFIMAELLLLFIGQFIWNNTLIKLIPSVQPLTSVWDLLLLSILFRLFSN
jgi:hypothetical protein